VVGGYGTRRLELLYADDTDPSVIPADREYKIVPALSGDPTLRCDKLLTSSPVSVQDFDYRFFTQ